MKKIISFIAGFAIACGVFSGCVEDNQYVVLDGIAVRSCEATGTSQSYGGTCGMSTTRTMKDGSSKPVENKLFAHITNAITGASVWSSSGSSSSGSTFDTSIPNAGMIFIDEIIIRCESINGDKSACDDIEPIKLSDNHPVKANSGTCIGFGSTGIEEWGDNIIVSVQVGYHDSSYIKGKTGKAYISFSSSKTYNEANGVTNPCAPEDAQTKESESSSGSSGSDSQTPSSGGSGDDKDPGNDQDPDKDKPSTDKKSSGASCGHDFECESGKCIEKIEDDTSIWVCE